MNAYPPFGTIPMMVGIAAVGTMILQAVAIAQDIRHRAADGAQMVLIATPSTKNWSQARHNGMVKARRIEMLGFLNLALVGAHGTIPMMVGIAAVGTMILQAVAIAQE